MSEDEKKLYWQELIGCIQHISELENQMESAFKLIRQLEEFVDLHGKLSDEKEFYREECNKNAELIGEFIEKLKKLPYSDFGGGYIAVEDVDIDDLIEEYEARKND